MPRIFDNIEETLSEALRVTLNQADKADFCVGYFNLRGWGKISDLVAARFNGQGENYVRVLVGMQRPPEEEMRLAQAAVNRDGVIDGPARARLAAASAQSFKQQLEFGLPTAQAERALQELATQLKGGLVKVKLFLRHPLHAKLYLIRRPDPITPTVAYMGSSNLTLSGLSAQGELNVDIVEQDAAAKLQNWFDTRWNDELGTTDITEQLLKLIEDSWARETLTAPYLVYLKMIYSLCEDARQGAQQVKLPEEFQRDLLDFQAEAVKLAAQKLHRRGGVLLGDVVGLGKTIMASAVAKVFEEDERRGRTLILCPPNLVPMWKGYVGKYNLRADTRSIGMVPTGLEDLKGRYTLVIIDESHNLRNSEGKRYKAIREFISEQEAHCLLLTATPYNKQYSDISSQLRLFWSDDQELGIRPERFFREVWTPKGLNEADFRAKFGGASPRSLRAFDQSTSSDDWRSLLRLFMVRRTRSHVKTYYASYDANRNRHYVAIAGERRYLPVREPDNLTFKIDEDNPSDQYARLYRDEVVGVIEHLALPRYGLGNYLKDLAPRGKVSADEKLLRENLSRAGQRLVGFARTNLFKRLESSGYSFLLSLQRHVLRNLVTLHALENGLDLPIGTQDVAALDSTIRDSEEEWLDETQADEQSPLENQYLGVATPLEDYRKRAGKVYELYRRNYSTRFEWVPARLFRPDLNEDLLRDAKALMAVYGKAGKWNPSQDTKLARLYRLLTVDHSGEKVLVFSQFADTVEYLGQQLRERYGMTDIDAVTAQSSDPTHVAYLFSPVSNGYRLKAGEKQLRVLMATDVLAEGQNLQDASIVVNYDLPWAIIRLIQRAGRVDRIGQLRDTIKVYSFWTADGVERVIALRDRLTRRLQQNQEVIGTDESFFGEQAADKLRDLYTEKASVLEADEDEDVDLASLAYGIWMSASEDARRQAEKLPAVIYATKPHVSAEEDPDGAVVYLRFPSGEDGLLRVDPDTNVVSQSLVGILNAAASEPETPALPRREDHHELVASAVRKAIAEVNDLGGQLGSLRSTSRKVWERLSNYSKLLEQEGRDISRIARVLDVMHSYPMTERARESFGRELRLGITDERLASYALNWYEDEGLVVPTQEREQTEPVVICSMGLKAA